jgi:PPM family protein phosphatase
MPEQRRSDTVSVSTTIKTPDQPVGGVPGPGVHVDMCGLTDRGLKRENNEDHFLVSRIDRTFRTLQTNVPDDLLPASLTDTINVMIVADGMGGHAGGEHASRMAITAFVDMVLRTPNLIMRLDGKLAEQAVERTVRRFEAIKDALVEAVHRDPSLDGMGTTMTLAASFGADVIVGHVGDSRLYLFRRGELKRLTRDQTMAQFLRDTGLCTDAELATHPLRHTLTGVLGTQGTPIDVDVHGLRLEDGDELLLCTDGLTEMVAEPEIRKVLAESLPTASDVCERLVALANANGGRDNITVVLARYHLTA